jgi:uncharacterized protein (DUF1501 family)
MGNELTSRRVFLRNGGLALVSLGFAPTFLSRTVAAASARKKLLVAIFQRGAVDGLNVVVPYGEREYYRRRPTIAVPRPGDGVEGAVDLDGFFAFHPRLRPLEPLYRNGTLAVVHACGSPDGTRSHFDAQDYMESGTPGVKSTEDGWLNRTLRAEHAGDRSPFRAVALAPVLPRSLQGQAPALAIGQIGQFGIHDGTGSAIGASFEAQYASAADVVLKGTGQEAFDAIGLMKRADPSQYRPSAGAQYPASAFGQALKQIAQLAKSDVGLEIAFAETGNWDHHVNEGSTQGLLAARLDDFGRGLAALVTDLGDRMSDTVIVTMSEFGRALAENGNRGTDHGHGNAMLVMGTGIKGGKVYGRWPGLGDEALYERRDLAVTTDFRDVFAEIVTTHLGVTDPSGIFPGYTIEPARQPGFMARA